MGVDGARSPSGHSMGALASMLKVAASETTAGAAPAAVPSEPVPVAEPSGAPGGPPGSDGGFRMRGLAGDTECSASCVATAGDRGTHDALDEATGASVVASFTGALAAAAG